MDYKGYMKGKKKDKNTLDDLMTSSNIANMLEQDELDKIGCRVMEGFEYDEASREEWLDEVNQAIDMAKLKALPKSFPWKNAANVRIPIISTACTQFAARTYPEIVKNGRVVHCATIGRQPNPEGDAPPPQAPPPPVPGQPPEQGGLGMMAANPTKELNLYKDNRSKRVSTFMNWQLLVETDEWERSTDRLLTILPIVGTVFRKTHFDLDGFIIRSELCLPHEIVINNNVTSLEDAPRVSHIIHLTKNKIVGHMRSGIYTDYDLKELDLSPCEDYSVNYEDDDIEAIEQHCWLDLDYDDYEEPYIVVVHRKTKKVLRIVARYDSEGVFKNDEDEIIKIEPVHYFTDFHFMPSVDGSYYGMGFGVLLLSLNKTVNSVTNMLLNAGALASLQGGFIGKGLRIKGGDMSVRPGQWQSVDSFGQSIKDNIVPINYKEPSTVLYQLLGFMFEHIDRLTSVTDALSGTERAQNAPATTILSMIEQGLKVFTSIMRRQYWAFKKEFKKIYRLNRLYITDDKYKRVLDDPEANLEEDFEADSYDICPIADPNVSSDVQRAQKVEYLLKLKSDPDFHPRINADALLTYALQAADIPNPESFLQPRQEPSPDIKLLELQLDMAKFKAEHEMAGKEFAAKNIMNQALLELYQAQEEQYKATAVKLLTDAQTSSHQVSLGAIKTQLEAAYKKKDQVLQTVAMLQKGEQHKDEYDTRLKELEQAKRDASTDVVSETAEE